MAIDIKKLDADIKNNPAKLGAVLLADRCLMLMDRIKELEVAIDGITNEDNFHPVKDWAICGICHNSSSGTDGRESRMKEFYKFISLMDNAKKLIELKD